MIGALQELIGELKAIPEADEKLKFLLSLAQDLAPFPDSERLPENLISGCASNAYLVAEYRDGKIFLRGDADAQIPKGVLALFILGCDGAKPEEIIALAPDILKDAGLMHILSPSRSNGAYQIFQHMQHEARKCMRESRGGFESSSTIL